VKRRGNRIYVKKPFYKNRAFLMLCTRQDALVRMRNIFKIIQIIQIIFFILKNFFLIFCSLSFSQERVPKGVRL